MDIGFVTDEISPDVAEAIRIGASWGIRHYELRMVGAERVPAITTEQAGELEALRDEHHLQYTALSPGTFKCALEDTDTLESELQTTLPATFELAKRLEIGMVIVFGFQRGNTADTVNGRAIDRFRQIADMAAAEEIVVTVENEPGFWCDSGSNTAAILDAVDSPWLKANWDPANAIGTAEVPYPDGYAAIRHHIANVHIKDSSKGALVECVPVGEGKVDWEGQLQAIVRDQLVSHVTIETHCLPLVEKSSRNLETVRKILSAAEQNGG